MLLVLDLNVSVKSPPIPPSLHVCKQKSEGLLFENVSERNIVYVSKVTLYVRYMGEGRECIFVLFS